MDYIPTIGLEVHVQLRTQSKMFCACSAGYGADPNTHVCPVCLGYPGALPVMNSEAIRLTVMTGLCLGCAISEYSKFDRKSYFYPDMPKNYQISQYDKPLCLGGGLEIESGGGPRLVRLTRIHLEEDVGKNMHFPSASGVDFNRAGVPLMEIVTEPDIESPEDAFAFLQALKGILLYAGVSDCNLEEGNMRCDVNISVRPSNRSELGTKTEIKNMNTFKGVLHALRYEVKRQIEVLRDGGTIRQETRRWNMESGVTESMRTKESAHDYRYFPEPDLMPVVLSSGQIEEWRGRLPELPGPRRKRFIDHYGLPPYDAGVLAADKAVADYFESVVSMSVSPKAASNWVMTEMLRLLSEREADIRSVKVTPAALAELIKLAESRTVNSNTAREIFTELFDRGGEPREIVKERGLSQVSDLRAIEAMVERVVAGNPRPVAEYRSGKTQTLKFLVGQVMKLSQGKADPQVASGLIEKVLRGS